ncbi:MAG: hypothetical protein K5663_06400 [Clostridiales bacterium]|nr:hypothetical protein [Clostridiales bacterium]
MKRAICLALCALAFALFLNACAEGEGTGKVLVALGDSYTAGEGIEPFYGQDAPMSVKCKDPDWLTHRSERAWPGMLTLPGVEGTLAQHRGENYFTVAASGARTNHLFLLTDEDKAAGYTADMEKKYDREGITGMTVIAPQLDIFDELDAKGLKADYVVLSIGGNDVDFKSIMTMSVLGKTVSTPGETNVDKGVNLMEKQYTDGNVRSKLKRAFHDVAARAGSQAAILVVGYPYPMIDETVGGAFSKDSAAILNEATYFFCTELINVVDECRNEGLNICYVDVSTAFEGHSAYAEETYFNNIIFLAGKQDLDSSAIVSSSSMHPNLKGAEAIARCVQYVIDHLEAGSERYIFDYFPEDD